MSEADLRTDYRKILPPASSSSWYAFRFVVGLFPLHSKYTTLCSVCQVLSQIIFPSKTRANICPTATSVLQ